MNEFKNRESSTLNYKILDVKSVNRDESGEITSMEVEVIRNDEKGLTQEGTPLDAENLNNIVKGMINDVVSLLPLTDETIINIDKMYLKIPTEATESFNLPLVGEYGSAIEWNSNNSEIVEINGSTAIVAQDIYTKSCTLTATITKGSAHLEKEFSVTVPYREMTDMERVVYDSNNTFISEYVTSSFPLPTTGLKGSTIEWIAGISDGVSLTSDNRIEFTRPTYNTGVILSGTFKYGAASINRRFDVTIIGTDCYTPKSLSTSITQIDGSLQNHQAKISTSNLEGLYVEIENDDKSYITVEVLNNDTNEVTLVVGETTYLNSISGSGTYNFDYKVNVYLNSDHSLLLGTINGVVTYYATSNTPED